MDANKQLPQGSNPEMDRRRMIYKNIRNEIIQTDQAAKEAQVKRKMTELESKLAQKEKERLEQDAIRR